jgi:DNA-binding transcriptional MerR regulator
MEMLLTTGVLAREAECSVECIRDLHRRGIIKAQRDSVGRRLFSKTAAEQIKAYRDARAKRVAL